MVGVAEIEAAYERRYNHWRRLVTHHDPEMVARANQALRVLERIHGTLTDPQKRAVYDASIGTGQVGGLADPQAVSKVTTPPSPTETPKPSTEAVPRPLDAWLCPECGFASPAITRFCKECGHTLGRDCPQCGKLIEANARFCPGYCSIF